MSDSHAPVKLISLPIFTIYVFLFLTIPIGIITPLPFTAILAAPGNKVCVNLGVTFHAPSG